MPASPTTYAATRLRTSGSNTPAAAPTTAASFGPAWSWSCGSGADDEVAHRQHLEAAVLEGADAVLGRADDRLLVHVVAGVDQRRDAGARVVLAQDPVHRRVDI